jgi:hypothetical protein
MDDNDDDDAAWGDDSITVSVNIVGETAVERKEANAEANAESNVESNAKTQTFSFQSIQVVVENKHCQYAKYISTKILVYKDVFLIHLFYAYFQKLDVASLTEISESLSSYIYDEDYCYKEVAEFSFSEDMSKIAPLKTLKTVEDHIEYAKHIIAQKSKDSDRVVFLKTLFRHCYEELDLEDAIDMHNMIETKLSSKAGETMREKRERELREVAKNYGEASNDDAYYEEYDTMYDN